MAHQLENGDDDVGSVGDGHRSTVRLCRGGGDAKPCSHDCRIGLAPLTISEYYYTSVLRLRLISGRALKKAN